MTQKSKTFMDVFSTDARDFLNEALVEGSDGLFGMIPEYNLDHTRREAQKTGKIWVAIGSAPKPQDINTSRTSDDMILDGKAVLKDGRHVTW